MEQVGMIGGELNGRCIISHQRIQQGGELIQEGIVVDNSVIELVVVSG